MTTAHRPTFDPAKGKETDVGSILHSRMLPAETKLKFRKPGQGGDADKLVSKKRHYQQVLERDSKEDEERKIKIRAKYRNEDVDSEDEEGLVDESHEVADNKSDGGESGLLSKEIDAEGKLRGSEDEEDDDEERKEDDQENEDEDEDEDDEDEEALLLAELEKIKKERAEQKNKQLEEEEKAAVSARESEIAFKNPLMGGNAFKLDRSWTEETVFKNQAGPTAAKKGEFINDMIRSDFHRKFIKKYIQ